MRLVFRILAINCSGATTHVNGISDFISCYLHVCLLLKIKNLKIYVSLEGLRLWHYILMFEIFANQLWSRLKVLNNWAPLPVHTDCPEESGIAPGGQDMPPNSSTSPPRKRFRTEGLCYLHIASTCWIQGAGEVLLTDVNLFHRVLTRNYIKPNCSSWKATQQAFSSSPFYRFVQLLK